MQSSKPWWIKPLFKLKLINKDNLNHILGNLELTDNLTVPIKIIPQCKDNIQIQVICKIIIWTKEVNSKRTSIMYSYHKIMVTQEPWSLSSSSRELHLEIAFNVETVAKTELIQLDLHLVLWAVMVFTHQEALLDHNLIRHHQEVWWDQELKEEFHQQSQYWLWSSAHVIQIQTNNRIPEEIWSELIEEKSSQSFCALRTQQTVACVDNSMLSR